MSDGNTANNDAGAIHGAVLAWTSACVQHFAHAPHHAQVAGGQITANQLVEPTCQF